jgi:aminoglycoside phosphotransferase (APT) family kinase protein
VWFHGDVAVNNLLVRDGRLAAVLDFGSSGVGDPEAELARRDIREVLADHERDR